MSRLLYLLKNPWQIPIIALIKLPYFKFIHKTQGYQCPISFGLWFKHKILNAGGNKKAYWPVHPNSKIVNPENIYAGVDTCPGVMQGCYIQAIGKVYIGDYTQIAPNVIIISANHDLYDTRKHIVKSVHIGKYSWIGAGALIMPGVELGDFTIVGAGAVVTKSFKDGHCVIGGNPAKVIKDLEREKCIPYNYPDRYFGYISEEKFEAYRKKKLNV